VTELQPDEGILGLNLGWHGKFSFPQPTTTATGFITS